MLKQSFTDNFTTDQHGWSEMLPARQSGEALKGDHRVPWVVIGAGFTGLSCARRLAELHPQDTILLFDARLVGQAASGRNSGFAVATSQFAGTADEAELEHQRRINRINRVGLERLGKQVEAYAIDCQWQREGFYHTAAGPVALAEYDHFRRYLDRLNIDHQVLDPGSIAQRLGTDWYKAGIHVADGALVQPAALVRGLAESLPANVQLYEQHSVLKVEAGAQPTLRLAAASVVTDKLIIAANFEAGSLGFLNRYLLGSTLSGSFTRQLNREELDSLGSLREWGALSLHGGGATLRLTHDGRIKIRNTAEYHGARLLSDAQLKRRQLVHRAAFDKRFPQLAHVPFEFAWSGVEGISRNGTNFFAEQRKGIYLAGGYNGSGVSRGTAFGMAIADYASGETSQTVSDCLASRPGSWIPPRPLLDIGAFFTVRSRFRGVGVDR